MTSLRAFLRDLREKTEAPARAPRPQPAAGPEQRLSDVLTTAGCLRIRSRLLGEIVVVVRDAEATYGSGAYSASEIIALLGYADRPQLLRALHRIRMAVGPWDLLTDDCDPRPDLAQTELWSRALTIASAMNREIYALLHSLRAAGAEMLRARTDWRLVLPSEEWDEAKQQHIRQTWIEPAWSEITRLFDEAAGSQDEVTTERGSS
jgi:hypothetical protein